MEVIWMKRIMGSMCAGVLLVTVVAAQTGPAKSGNPVTSAAKQIMERQSRNLVAAAEKMPEDQWGYKPTPQQRSFGETISHTAESNNKLCGAISGMPPRGRLKPAVFSEKSDAVTALRESFDYCKEALDKVDDSRLNEQVEVFGGRKVSRAAALFMLTNDWADHYSALAGYLRLKGILPPTARGEAQSGSMKPTEKK
jgi:uncharacterized damage-inducible protein DinB